MGRRFRSTEVSGTVDIASNGQNMHCNWFCVNCHAVNSHYGECTKPETYAIPATAEVPRRKATKRIWNIFKKQFVYSKPNGWWFYKERSWWNKNKTIKETNND